MKETNPMEESVTEDNGETNMENLVLSSSLIPIMILKFYPFELSLLKPGK